MFISGRIGHCMWLSSALGFGDHIFQHVLQSYDDFHPFWQLIQGTLVKCLISCFMRFSWLLPNIYVELGKGTNRSKNWISSCSESNLKLHPLTSFWRVPCPKDGEPLPWSHGMMVPHFRIQFFFPISFAQDAIFKKLNLCILWVVSLGSNLLFR